LSASELITPGSGVKTQRLVFFSWRFYAVFGGYMLANRALKAAQVPCALFAAA
jgi:hypothetical protein